MYSFSKVPPGPASDFPRFQGSPTQAQAAVVIHSIHPPQFLRSFPFAATATATVNRHVSIKLLSTGRFDNEEQRRKQKIGGNEQRKRTRPTFNEKGSLVNSNSAKMRLRLCNLLFSSLHRCLDLDERKKKKGRIRIAA